MLIAASIVQPRPLREPPFSSGYFSSALATILRRRDAARCLMNSTPAMLDIIISQCSHRFSN